MKKEMFPVRLLFAGLLLAMDANRSWDKQTQRATPGSSNPQLKLSP